MSLHAETKRTMRLRFRLVLLPLVGVLALTTLPALAGAGAQKQTPAVGTAADAVDLSTVSGAVSYGDGWAIPLESAKPSWLTSELEQRVIAAEGTPLAAPTDAPLPSEVGIRPGSWMISPAGCTINLTHLVVDTKWLPSFIAGTRIGKILQIANGWALVNSPLCV